jgi:hypothetical protein
MVVLAKSAHCWGLQQLVHPLPLWRLYITFWLHLLVRVLNFNLEIKHTTLMGFLSGTKSSILLTRTLSDWGSWGFHSIGHKIVLSLLLHKKWRRGVPPVRRMPAAVSGVSPGPARAHQTRAPRATFLRR